MSDVEIIEDFELTPTECSDSVEEVESGEENDANSSGKKEDEPPAQSVPRQSPPLLSPLSLPAKPQPAQFPTTDSSPEQYPLSQPPPLVYMGKKCITEQLIRVKPVSGLPLPPQLYPAKPQPAESLSAKSSPKQSLPAQPLSAQYIPKRPIPVQSLSAQHLPPEIYSAESQPEQSSRTEFIGTRHFPVHFTPAQHHPLEHFPAVLNPTESVPTLTPLEESLLEQPSHEDLTGAQFPRIQYTQTQYIPAKPMPEQHTQEPYAPRQYTRPQYTQEVTQEQYKQEQYTPAHHISAEFPPAQFTPAQTKRAKFTHEPLKRARFTPIQSKSTRFTPAGSSRTQFTLASSTRAQHTPTNFTPSLMRLPTLRPLRPLPPLHRIPKQVEQDSATYTKQSSHTEHPGPFYSYTENPEPFHSYTEKPEPYHSYTENLESSYPYTENPDPFSTHTENPDPFSTHTENLDPFSTHTENPDPFSTHTENPDPFSTPTENPEQFSSYSEDPEKSYSYTEYPEPISHASCSHSVMATQISYSQGRHSVLYSRYYAVHSQRLTTPKMYDSASSDIGSEPSVSTHQPSPYDTESGDAYQSSSDIYATPSTSKAFSESTAFPESTAEHRSPWISETSPTSDPSSPSTTPSPSLDNAKLYPVMWFGFLSLRDERLPIRMHYLFGDMDMASAALNMYSMIHGNELIFTMNTYMDLSHLRNANRKMKVDNQHCMLLGMAGGSTSTQHDSENKLLTFIKENKILEIINIHDTKLKEVQYAMQVFPSCDFTIKHLAKSVPNAVIQLLYQADFIIVITIQHKG